jgi:hypothetical protein
VYNMFSNTLVKNLLSMDVRDPLVEARDSDMWQNRDHKFVVTKTDHLTIKWRLDKCQSIFERLSSFTSRQIDDTGRKFNNGYLTPIMFSKF